MTTKEEGKELLYIQLPKMGRFERDKVTEVEVETQRRDLENSEASQTRHKYWLYQTPPYDFSNFQREKTWIVN